MFMFTFIMLVYVCVCVCMLAAVDHIDSENAKMLHDAKWICVRVCASVLVCANERIPKRTSRTNHVLSGLVIYDPSNK